MLFSFQRSAKPLANQYDNVEKFMKIRKDAGLTFDDVLLVPRRSSIKSRREVSTATTLLPGISLSLPIVSANMDTVTESTMAIAMARLGGVGVIHRFMTIERQVSEVTRVKRAENLIIENPYMIESSLTAEDARKLIQEWGCGGLLVTDAEKHLLGVLTPRDLLFEDDPKRPINELMTPRERLVTAPPNTTIAQAREILHRAKVEKLPLVSEDNRVIGLITAKDIIKHEQHPHATKDQKGRLRVGAAIGVKEHDLERAAALVETGVDFLVLDIAHGHSDYAIEMLKTIRQQYGDDLNVVAGNVATSDGVKDLVQIGVNAIKVGVGPGSICITRRVTGFGMPQLTAIMECAKAAHKSNVPIIADGGIRTSGDLTKALAAGAQTVMIGSLFAGTHESPGQIVQRKGQRYKITRGMASLSATMSRQDNTNINWDQIVPEGVEAMVPYRGSVVEIVQHLMGGLRSGMSYAGANTITELQNHAEFIPITPVGLVESKPHDVELY